MLVKAVVPHRLQSHSETTRYVCKPSYDPRWYQFYVKELWLVANHLGARNTMWLDRPSYRESDVCVCVYVYPVISHLLTSQIIVQKRIRLVTIMIEKELYLRQKQKLLDEKLKCLMNLKILCERQF